MGYPHNNHGDDLNSIVSHVGEAAQGAGGEEGGIAVVAPSNDREWSFNYGAAVHGGESPVSKAIGRVNRSGYKSLKQLRDRLQEGAVNGR